MSVITVISALDFILLVLILNMNEFAKQLYFFFMKHAISFIAISLLVSSMYGGILLFYDE